MLVGLCFLVLSCIAGPKVRADCYNDTSFWTAMKQVWIEFSSENEKSLVISAWVANTPEQRAHGFQEVCPSLISDRSLLFSFPVPVRVKFHMTGVAVPLDIAFIDVSRQIIDVQRMVLQDSSQPVRYYQSSKEIYLALETMAGRLDQLRQNPSQWRMHISSNN